MLSFVYKHLEQFYEEQEFLPRDIVIKQAEDKFDDSYILWTFGIFQAIKMTEDLAGQSTNRVKDSKIHDSHVSYA